MIHEVELTGYDVKYTGEGTLTLGTWDSFGIERLHITADSDWDGLTILATFRIGSTSVRALMEGDGMVSVPPEATSEAGSGVIVFSGTDGEMLRVSRNLKYKVLDHDPIDGEDSQLTPSEWEQLVGRVDGAKKEASKAAELAEQNANSAAGSATDAASGAANAKNSETSAAYSASAAARSADAASASAMAAASSEASAEGSKVAASASETEARKSQSAAAESASRAEESENAAKSSASAAATSASAAENSKTAAAGSSTAASASADAASASASIAKSSESSAAGSAKAAAASETEAKSYKDAAQEAARQAEESAQLAQQISQGAMGWYATDTDLKATHPTGQNGQWAIVGSTDTIWTWDSDTGTWKNTSVKTDLSGYFTKEQADGRFATTDQGNRADTAVQSVNGVTPQTGGAVTIPTGVTMDLLWENPNPASEFSQQTVSLNLSQYQFVLIMATNYLGNNYVAPVLCPVGAGGMILVPYTSLRSRKFTVDAAGVAFENGYYSGQYGVVGDLHNDVCIPQAIFGVRL